jgi:ribosomal protein S18 acetylase RimI-like enzyme
MESLQIKPLTEDDLEHVVQIHQNALGYTFNSRLGVDHLSFLYRTMLHDDQSYVGVASIDNQPVGVVSGTLDMEKIKAFLLSSFKFRQWANLLFHVLGQPSLIHEWWKGNRIGTPVYFEGNLVQPILTAIAVDSSCQGKGIGKCLVRDLERFFQRKDIKVYRLDTLIGNSSARKFYESIGFQQVEMRADSIVFVKKIVHE